MSGKESGFIIIRQTVAYIIIAGLTTLLYWNSIYNEYSFDDEYVTDTNELVKKGISAIPEIFTTNYIVHENYKLGYRPLVKASYAVEYEFFGGNPHISHLINIALYALCGIALFFLLSSVFYNHNRIFPLLIACLFVAHPVHTEVVNSLKNRDELLSFIFGILSVICFIRYAKKNGITYLITGSIVFLLAMMSKISSLTFVAVIPVLLYFFKLSSFRKIIVSTTVLAIVAIGFFVLVFIFLPSATRQFHYIEAPIAYEGSLGIKTASVFYSLGYYLKLLFFPHPLGFYYGYNQIPLVGWGNPWAVLSLIIYGLLVIYSLFYLRRRAVLTLSILIYLLFISPFSNILYPVPGIISERALFAASLGFCIAMGYIILKITKVNFLPAHHFSQIKKYTTKETDYQNKVHFNYRLIGILVIIFSLYGYKTISRNFDWKNRLTLFAADIDYLDNSTKAHQIYAHYLRLRYQDEKNPGKKRELIDKTLKHYKRAEAIYDKWHLVQKDLGLVYVMDMDQPGKAVIHFKKAIALKPGYTKATYNLAKTYEILSQPDSAIKYYEKTLAIDSNHFLALNNLSILHYQQGDTAAAFNYNQQFIRAYPSSSLPYLNAGTFYLMAKDTVKAIPYFEKVAAIDPENREVLEFLHRFFKSKGQKKKIL